LPYRSITDNGAQSVNASIRGAIRVRTHWASLTRAELDVLRLVSEGMGNKEVAARLFVSPRTVQAHLTNIYR